MKNLFNTIFVSSHMYPENPEGIQVIVILTNGRSINTLVSTRREHEKGIGIGTPSGTSFVCAVSINQGHGGKSRRRGE